MLCVDRLFFLEAGGLDPRTGDYALLDFCLRTTLKPRLKPQTQITAPPAPCCRYLPDVCLTALKGNAEVSSGQDKSREAVWFYGKWQGELWQNDHAFYEKENISNVVLDTEKLTRSMPILNRF